MRISDWSSDVCSSDLIAHFARFYALHALMILAAAGSLFLATRPAGRFRPGWLAATALCLAIAAHLQPVTAIAALAMGCRSEERRVGTECVRTDRSRL